MKKYLAIFMVLMAFAGTSFAATAITPDATTEIGGAAFVPSTGVTLQAQATNTAYAAQSKHLSGNKMYGTLSSDSDISTDSSVAIGDTCTAPSSATALNGTWD